LGELDENRLKTEVIKYNLEFSLDKQVKKYLDQFKKVIDKN